MFMLKCESNHQAKTFPALFLSSSLSLFFRLFNDEKPYNMHYCIAYIVWLSKLCLASIQFFFYFTFKPFFSMSRLCLFRYSLDIKPIGFIRYNFYVWYLLCVSLWLATTPNLQNTLTHCLRQFSPVVFVVQELQDFVYFPIHLVEEVEFLFSV